MAGKRGHSDGQSRRGEDGGFHGLASGVTMGAARLGSSGEPAGMFAGTAGAAGAADAGAGVGDAASSSRPQSLASTYMPSGFFRSVTALDGRAMATGRIAGQ